MMSVFNKRREFFRFILVGVLATATHYGIYFFLCVLMLPAIAYTIGYAISFILNFYLSNIFTFNTKPTVRKGIGFGISHFINYLLHIGLLSLFIWIGVPERLFLFVKCHINRYYLVLSKLSHSYSTPLKCSFPKVVVSLG